MKYSLKGCADINIDDKNKTLSLGLAHVKCR